MFSLLNFNAKQQILERVQGQTRPGINREILKGIAIPVPPLSEERRIVAEVERRLSVVQEVESVIAANLARAERLRQSILKRAFEGKLVPQDPNDEPASVLLERIRAVGAVRHPPLREPPVHKPPVHEPPVHKSPAPKSARRSQHKSRAKGRP